jgi:hypothetical protein
MGSRDRARASASAGYIFLLSVIGLAAIFHFAYTSFSVLKLACPVCMTVYVAVLGVFITATRADSPSIGTLFGRLFEDIAAVFKRPTAAALAVVWLVASVGLVIYFRDAPLSTPTAAAPAPAAPVETLDEAQLTEWHQWLDRQPRIDGVAPTGDARVLLIKYNDYQCPSCRATWAAYKDLIARLEAKYEGAFKYETRDYPLEPECGMGGAHGSACEGAVAVRLAREKGRAPEMEAWLYEHQPELSRDAIKGALSSIAGVSGDDFDARYASVLTKVREDAQFGNKLGVQGTPTFFLNGIRLPSVRPAHLEAAIVYELQRAGVS